MPNGIAVRPSRRPGVNVGPSRRIEETFTPERTYPAAIEQTARDYDELMGRYRFALEGGRPDTSGMIQRYEQLLNQAPQAYTPFTPERQAFAPTTGIQDIEELARTGGLSQEGISELRARGVSPIRAVYANAMRQLDRQRALQGGYSPNMPAAQARMARELSEQIGGATTNVNAEIARMVQQGRLQAAPTLAGIREREAGRESEIGRANIAAQTRAEEFNRAMLAQMRDEDFARQRFALQGITGLQQAETGMEAELLGGMRGLYGTTPALAETFGRQALQAEGMARQPIPIRRSARSTGGISRGRTGLPFTGSPTTGRGSYSLFG